MTSGVVTFEDFVRGNSGALMRTLTLVALDREAAADASQEAFFQLYLHWPKISIYDDPVACSTGWQSIAAATIRDAEFARLVSSSV